MMAFWLGLRLLDRVDRDRSCLSTAKASVRYSFPSPRFFFYHLELWLLQPHIRTHTHTACIQKVDNALPAVLAEGKSEKKRKELSYLIPRSERRGARSSGKSHLRIDPISCKTPAAYALFRFSVFDLTIIKSSRDPKGSLVAGDL